MSDKLSNCPFCGSAVRYIQGYAPLDDCHFIDCEGCGVSTKIFDSKDEAIAAWNRRASPAPAIPAEPSEDAIDAVRTVLQRNSVYFSRPSIEAIARAALKAAPAISERLGAHNEPAPAWMTCESRRPFVVNSLRARAEDLRTAEKRCRNAYRKDFMGFPARYLADAFGEAAKALEERLSAFDAARAGGKS